MAYNVVSNATLWFCHHHLFDSARRPRTDAGGWRHGTRTESSTSCRPTVAEVAPEGGRASSRTIAWP